MQYKEDTMIHNSSNFIFNATDWITYNHFSCDDQIFAEIIYRGGRFVNSSTSENETLLDMRTKNSSNGYSRINVDYSNSSPLPNNKKIVLLLESPSNDEYNANGILGNTAPCWGATGENIKKNLLAIMNSEFNLTVMRDFLNKITVGEKIDLYAVNAIRYQCDLGNPGGGKNTRNIFYKMWSKAGFKEDLFERLRIILPDLIINCCTKMISQQVKLSQELKKVFSDKVLECSHHPCVWLEPSKVKLS